MQRYIYIVFALVISWCSLSPTDVFAQEEINDNEEVVVAPLIDGVTVSGTIVYERTGLPLEGIGVSFGNITSTFTNASGQFTLTVPSYSSTVLLRWNDHIIREVSLRGRSNVQIQVSDLDLEKVGTMVDLPYRRSLPNHVTDAVSSVSLRDAWMMNAVSPETAIQGTAAGVNVIRRSGALGIGANMFIRGLPTLNAYSQPLVVVDGMIYDMNEGGNSIIDGYFSNPLALIDIKDIAEVTFIKDGSSIYGSRAANGVMLIRTSKAESLATKIDFHTYGGVNFRPRTLPVMETGDYKPYLSQMLQSSGLTSGEVQQHPYMNERRDTLGYYNYHNNTPWQNLVMNTSYDQNHYIKVTGGDNIATYALSLGHLQSEGVTGNESFARSNVRFNGDFNINERLKAATNMSFSYAVADQYMYGQTAAATSPIFTALTKAPILAPNLYSEDGIRSPNLSVVDAFGKTNPLAIIEGMQGQNRRFRFFGSFSGTYLFTENISLTSLYGLTFDQTRETFFVPSIGVETVETENALIRNRMGGHVQRLLSSYSDTRFDYNKLFNNVHNLNIGLGFRYHNNNLEEDRGFAYNSGTDDLVTLESGILTLNEAGGGVGNWAWMSYYANANYNFMSKYFLTGTLSVDGSSRFGAETVDGISLFGHRFGVFPSVSGAWLISSENFMQNSGLDLLKLRLSYGLTGNDGIGNYGSFQVYRGSNLLGMQGLVRSNIANTELQWETNAKANAGIDIATLNQRLSFSVDFYQNNIFNMLTYQPLNVATGLDFYLTNAGSMTNRGVDLGINARVIEREVKLDLGLTVGRYINELTDVPYDSRLTNVAGGEMISRVGNAAAMFYGYQTEGVYSTSAEAAASGLTTPMPNGSLAPFRAGDVRFVDVNNDGIIDANDKQIIGNPNPDFFGSFMARAAYKRFSFDAAFTFTYGNDIYNYVRQQMESMSNFDNQFESVRNRWRTEGQQTDMPRLDYGDPMGNSRFSDRWIEDGSYLRLKAVNVTYLIPVNGNIIKDVTVYASGQNLLTFTNYLGYDPEVSYTRSIFGQGVDVGLMPQYRSFLVGLKIGL